MKRVLILAYDFPPLMSAGAARPYGWYLYMKKYGLEPIVVTRKWPEQMQSELEIMQASQSGTETEQTSLGTLIKVDYAPNLRDRWAQRKPNFANIMVRKFLSGFYNYRPFLSLRDDATANMYREADQYLQQQPVDMILATGGPFHLFRYATLLSARHKIPWFADFRDLWSYYPNHGLGFMNEVVQKRIKRQFENRYLKTASALITVTEPLAEILGKAHGKEVFLSLNGYIDYQQSAPASVKADPETLKIAYIGTLYDYYPLEDFFTGYNRFASDHQGKISITFVGMEFHPQQKKKIQELTREVAESIHFTGKLSAGALQEALQAYDVLLLFGKENGLSIHIKLFEYLLLSKPILLFGKNNRVMGDIIRDTTSGYICETDSELQYVLNLLLKEKLTHGALEQQIKNIAIYSREYQTEKLVTFLKEKTETTTS